VRTKSPYYRGVVSNTLQITSLLLFLVFDFTFKIHFVLLGFGYEPRYKETRIQDYNYNVRLIANYVMFC